MWDGTDVTLLDFEGAIRVPRNMELDTIRRFTRNPTQFYGQGMHAEVSPADVTNVLPPS